MPGVKFDSRVPEGFYERLWEFLKKELDPTLPEWGTVNEPNQITIRFDLSTKAMEKNMETGWFAPN